MANEESTAAVAVTITIVELRISGHTWYDAESPDSYCLHRPLLLRTTYRVLVKMLAEKCLSWVCVCCEYLSYN